MTFSEIVKLQTSRRFVSSSSCGAPFEKFVTSGIGQRGGGGNMRAAEHFLTNILTVWTHNQWSLVFIDFCGFKHLFLNKNSWKQQNGHLTTKVLTWITRGYLDTTPLQVHGTIWTTMLRWWRCWPHQYWAWDLSPWDLETLRPWDPEILRPWDSETLRPWDLEILRPWDLETLRPCRSTPWPSENL